MSTAVANRYARALADVVSRSGAYREISRELEEFSAACRVSPELRRVFETPAIPFLEKTKVLQAILARLGGSTVTWNFLRVLLSHYRMNLIDEVAKAFHRLANDRLGVVEVRVASAAPLSEDEERSLRLRLELL